jgi:type IV pilus assembly protein PilM
VAGRTAVGLDIGTSGVRAAELAFGKGPATLQRFGQVALPVGAVRDGEVADPQLVADAIKHLWSTAKFSSKRVVLGVANQKVIVRQVDLPWMPNDELRKSLPMQVQDFIPIPVEQAILDYHAIEEVNDGAGARALRVLLVAASRRSRCCGPSAGSTRSAPRPVAATAAPRRSSTSAPRSPTS